MKSNQDIKNKKKVLENINSLIRIILILDTGSIIISGTFLKNIYLFTVFFLISIFIGFVVYCMITIYSWINGIERIEPNKVMDDEQSSIGSKVGTKFDIIWSSIVKKLKKFFKNNRTLLEPLSLTLFILHLLFFFIGLISFLINVSSF